ncbi:MAG TPA: DegT/DnrJ/EryC1/StrS family aminotransferase [Gemmatimonadales bacterium]|nr:DegT/DnrJ/EryC1/StrS family aminotransferase [Gemmatimonadales bacterium]
MNVPLLDLVAQYQSIKDEVLASLMGVVERQGFIMGPEVGALETALAELCHTRHGIACASGTDALLLPLKTLSLQPGDEVICPAFTFFATAGAVHNAGGTPVFADIDPATFNIDPAAIERAITPRTRAIVVVHLYGQMAAMERILPLAERHGLAVIEDGAQAIGARRKMDGPEGPTWRLAGELGTVGTLSFFPSKNLGAWGDGGMMVTQDDALAARLRKLRLHGGAKQYHHEEVGFNSRLDTLQAAVLLAKLPHLAAWNVARRQVAARYAEAFADLADAGLVLSPVTDPANEHIFHQYTIRARRRDALAEHLRARGIGHAIYYPTPLHLQPCFAPLGYARGALPVTEAATAEVLSLPIYPELTPERQDAVVAAVREFYQAVGAAAGSAA